MTKTTTKNTLKRYWMVVSCCGRRWSEAASGLMMILWKKLRRWLERKRTQKQDFSCCWLAFSVFLHQFAVESNASLRNETHLSGFSCWWVFQDIVNNMIGTIGSQLKQWESKSFLVISPQNNWNNSVISHSSSSAVLSVVVYFFIIILHFGLKNTFFHNFHTISQIFPEVPGIEKQKNLIVFAFETFKASNVFTPIKHTYFFLRYLESDWNSGVSRPRILVTAGI